MANFSTHMIGAATTGVVAASILAATDMLPVNAVPAGIGMVALGGIFPDVDSDHSDSIELVFSLLGVTLGIPVMIAVLPHYGLLLALAALGATYVAVRYGLIWFFRTVTVHRGVFHSVPMALAVTCLVATITNLGMGLDVVRSWMFAVLFFVGFITHLVLDEMYAVDLANRALKRSFGSALKVFERDRAVRYVLLYIAMAITIAFAPHPGEVLDSLWDVELRLLPERGSIALLWETLSAALPGA